MTTESNPLDTAPGYMHIIEYRWYGSAERVNLPVVL